MMSLARWCVLVLVLGLVGSLGYGLAQDRKATRLDAEVARQRANAFADSARAAGWTTQWAETVPDLLAEAAERDSMIARLREQVRLAGAHAVASATVEATAHVDTVLVADTVREPGAGGWTRHWRLRQRSIYGTAWYIPPDSLGTDLHARVRGRLIGSIAGDGRLLVMARPLDPDVELQVEAFRWSPPEPNSPGFPWLCAGVAFGSGGVVALEPQWWTAGAAAIATLLAC